MTTAANTSSMCASCEMVLGKGDLSFEMDLPESQPRVRYCAVCLQTTILEYFLLEEEGFA